MFQNYLNENQLDFAIDQELSSRESLVIYNENETKNIYRGSTGLGKYSRTKIVKNCFGILYYERVLRLLGNLKRINEYTTDNLLAKKFG